MTTHSTSWLAVHGGKPVRNRPFPEWPTSADSEPQPLESPPNAGLPKIPSPAGPADPDPVPVEAAVNPLPGDSGLGPDIVAAFEAEFAAYQDARHCACFCNGTLALAAALRGVDVGVGDEVIIPAYAYIACAAAVIFIGAVPVFADIEPDTHLLDPNAAEAAITERTKAIVPVHLAGRPADLDAFTELGERHRLAIVEEAGHAQGAEWHGTKVGAIGDAGAFSFALSTNIACGEGGAVVTNDDLIARTVNRLVKAKCAAQKPAGTPASADEIGFDLRLTEFEAAILLAQLPRHLAEREVVAANAYRLRRSLRRTEGIALPPENPGITAHGHYAFPFRLTCITDSAERNAFVAMLAAEGIPCTKGYGGLHRNAALRAEITHLTDRLHRPYPHLALPVTDQAVTDTVWLPRQVLLGTKEDTLDITTAIQKVLSAQRSGEV